MSDLDAILKKIQKKETTHINRPQGTGRSSLQWLLEQEEDLKTHPIHNNNDLKFLVCGEEGFASIEQDIRKATRSIDLVCWGFDPAMELTRMVPTSDPLVNGYQYWPRGTVYGDLLADKAKQGVQVRLLLWFASGQEEAVKGVVHMLLGNQSVAAKELVTAVMKRGIQEATRNADIPLVWQPMPGFVSAFNDLRAPKLQVRNAKPTTQEVRAAYVKAWWLAALSGGIANLEVRFRETDAKAIDALKQSHLPTALSATEELSISAVGTHHQKTILVDYHPASSAQAGTPNTCGYVMGLNSVTDYWDSPQHLYNDPRRESAYAVGAFWLEAWHVKPYRDYAMRVAGEALACVNRNFCAGWDKAKLTHAKLGSGALWAQREKFKPLPQGKHRAQIVRTQAEDKDATILKSYTLATSQAVNYIYIENQYVQLEHWARFVKSQRQKLAQEFSTSRQQALAKNPKLSLPEVPAPLFVFVVMPQAERGQMVPSTYATLAQLGQASTVRGYHNQVEALRQGKDPGGDALAKAILKDSLDAVPSTSAVADELRQLNVKSLTAMLMTYDSANQSGKLRIKQRDSEAEEARAANEARPSGQLSPTYGDAAKALADKALPPASRFAKRPSDVSANEYSDYNITPQRYREIYIHSKLMLVDDAFITLGSANLNKRSMVGDSELNIAVPDHGLAKAARQRVWGNLAGNDLDGGDGTPEITGKTFERWKSRMTDNAKNRNEGLPPLNGSFIHTYDDPRGAPLVRLA
jgi:phosphatidylserine/phosphatidylglycerophosphate/cardiolipin synthase-like enzyme